VLKKDPETLKKEIEKLPISEALVKHWQKNFETDPLQKALRFLLLSNFTYLGKGDTLRLGIDHTKRNLIDRIEPTFAALKNTKITSFDFREVLSKIAFSDSVTPKADSFVYLDPIYLGTDHYYKVPNWTISDTEDCFKLMATCGINCAMSEFSGPEIERLIKEYNMNRIPIKLRRNIKNERQELLITNYQESQTKITFL
jgi:DNA adenine methylase